MIPIVYWGNLWSEGVLSGSNSTPANPVRRIADGSIHLEYDATSGTTPSGVIQVTLSNAKSPDALVLASGAAISGQRFILTSEEVGGGSSATILDFTLAATVDRFVQTITGATARPVWRLSISGTLSGAQCVIRELQLASATAFPRSPEVGVRRRRVRQFARIPIPGGQAFVQREGPRLRETDYNFVVVSGSEVSGLERFVDGVDGGSAFTIVDDFGLQYFTELTAQDVDFNDAAGVYNVTFGFREIHVE